MPTSADSSIRARSSRRTPCVVLGLVAALGCSVDEGVPAPVEAQRSPRASDARSTRDGEPVPGVGPSSALVVWESNRSGAWRLWHRRLGSDGGDSEARMLSRDEPGRQHCCPHIAPDGRGLVYMALDGGRAKYDESGDTGELRWLSLDGEERPLAKVARTYFENRAVVWLSDDELVFIDGDRRTRRLHLATGETELLVDETPSERGWLIDPTLSRATSGRPTFSSYRREVRRVEESPRLGGCQPYFSRDGRWGFWVAGVGGPIDAIDFGTGERRTILRKRDPLLPEDAGYLYFPNLSSDNRWLAYAASDGAHDHFKSDYEVYLLEIDPSTMSAAGAPIRISHHPSTDRFPDVWVPPLPLGRHVGEVPLTVSLTLPTPPDPGGESARVDWAWGDGETSVAGSVAERIYRDPGRYTVSASRDGVVLEGEVMALTAAPPQLVETRLRGAGRAIELRFDEPLAPDTAVAEWVGDLAPTISTVSVEDGGETLRLELERPLDGPARLRVEGLTDRAATPNRAPPLELEVQPAEWPVRPDRLLFAWRAADTPNLVFDPEIGLDRASLLEPSGRAYLDREFGAVLAGGHFAADAETGRRLSHRIRETNELSLEVSVMPASGGGRRAIVALAAGSRRRNLVISQDGERLVAELLVGKRAATGRSRGVTLGRLPAGQSSHLLLTYNPGDLRAYLDGRPLDLEAKLRGDFFHWREVGLMLGDDGAGGASWRGAFHGLAIWDRALSESEAREAFERSRRLASLAEEVEVPVYRVRAERLRASRAPSQEEIEPYREALVVAEYRLEAVLGKASPPAVSVGDTLRVVERAMLDGERLPPPRSRGPSRELRLEPFDAQPQLDGLFLSDTLDAPEASAPLLFAVTPPA